MGDVSRAGTFDQPPIRSVRHAHDQLAEVAPFEHADERRGSVFQAIDHVFAQLHAARGDPCVDVAAEVVEAGLVVVEDDVKPVQ